MAHVRLLVIPNGQKEDAEGKGIGDNWEIAHLGDTATASVWLTTDHAHASDLCDDDVLNDPEVLGRFMVAALNGRPPLSLYRQAARLWGADAQMLMLVEECAELAQAVLHLRRGRINKEILAGELADVQIMIEQAMEMFDLGPLVAANKALKLDRLRDRVWKATPRREPPKLVPHVPPDPCAKNCGTCKHWAAVVDMDPDDPDDTTGVCENPARPWDTPEREASHDAWAAAFRAGEEWPCHEARVCVQEAATVDEVEP